MSKQELDNLVKIGQLKAEPPTRVEFTNMIESARKRLQDAQNEDLDPDSQFDLAYGAAHRLALAALRHAGYRSENRITVFQTLVHTVGADKTDIQIFLRAHNERNLAEYQGRMEVDKRLLAELIGCTKKLAATVGKLTPPAAE
jgi:hypothetical protein